jgi:hypothetical protein
VGTIRPGEVGEFDLGNVEKAANLRVQGGAGPIRTLTVDKEHPGGGGCGRGGGKGVLVEPNGSASFIDADKLTSAK